MKQQLIILLIGLYSCGHSAQPDKKIIDENESIKIATQNVVKVGEKIQGDFDGDGQVEFAIVTKTKIGQGNPLEDGTSDEFEIRFSTDKLMSIKIGCCNCRLINEGDMNNDGADEISIFQSPMNGCTYSMSTYAFMNENWVQIVKTFLIPTACEYISDEDLQKRIFKENDSIYYYKTDMNDENVKLIKTCNTNSIKLTDSLTTFLSSPLDLQSFKEVKGISNSGGYGHVDYFHKPKYKGFYIHYFIFKGFGETGPSIIAYRKGLDFGGFLEDRDSLIQLFSDRQDPDLKNANLVKKSIFDIKEVFGNEHLAEDGYIYYKGENNTLLTLYIEKGPIVRWFKWTRLNKKINSIDDIPEEIKNKSIH